MKRSGTCPVCLSNGPLTRGHTVPKSSGGRQSVGECGTCNGHFKIADPTLRRFIMYHGFFLNGGKEWFELSAPGTVPVVGLLEASGGLLRFWGQPSKNHPEAQRRFEESLNKLAKSG